MFTQNPTAPAFSTNKKGGLRSVLGGLFLILTFLVPLAFFPGIASLGFAAKISVIAILGALALIIFLLNVLGTGNIEFPKSKIISSLLLLPVVAIISSFFAGSVPNSIVGNAFEVGTSGFFVLMYFLFIVAIIGSSRESMLKRSIAVFLISIGFTTIYTFTVTIAQYAGATSLGIFPASLIGSYIDQAILLSVGALLSVYALNFTDISKVLKTFIAIFLVLSLLIIEAVGFQPIEIALAAFSLLIFVYLIAISRNEGAFWIKKTYATLSILIVSVIFVISGTPLSNSLSNILKINSFDVRPNFATTLTITKEQWKKNIITGAGPNRFVELWAKYKSPDINQTAFWSTDFFFGSGFLPTLFATLGILGVGALGLFFFFLLKRGMSAFFFQTEDSGKRMLAIILFLSALFLWVSSFLYNTGLTALSFAFIFTGLFVSSLANLGLVQTIKINIFANQKSNFVSVFLVVLLMIGTVTGSYFLLEKIIASVVFNKAALKFNTDGNVNAAGLAIEKAAGIYPTDTYYRALAELSLLNIESAAAAMPAGANVIPEEVKTKLQASVGSAVAYARSAIALDKDNYQNYLIQARIYESLALKGIQGAGENAKEAYTSAEKLSPLNPEIQLGFARLAAIAGNTSEAKGRVQKSINFKNNYTPAYFLLAQLEAATGNVSGVVKAIEGATIIDPQNSGLYFQLGLIKYQTKDFAGAATALEKALAIAPDYANAQYFLGLTYFNLGRKDNAIKQFENLQKTNANNKEVALILTNLKAGKDPFTGARPPVDAKPEKRAKPPITEKAPNQ